MTGAKKLHIRTWGCQMNVYDSDRMVDLLAAQGWQTTDDAEAADLVILNTCHIREKATEKVFSELGRLKRGREDRMIAVAGCVAQAEGEEITARAPWVDLVFGPQTYHTLPDMVAAAERARRGGDRARLVNTDFPTVSKFDHLPDAGRVTGGSAFLSVQEGCDKFCTFCVVPYTRGAEYSRPVEAILAEARSLIAAGAVEITLLGQNVNAFHGEGPDGSDWGLGRLIRRLADLPGLQRLRYTTSHPRDMDDALIDAHGAVDSLMPFLHLPVQSGSDRVLAAMNRKHSADDFRRIVDRLRAARPDLALSSDFIVGFPGETDRDFADTLRLVREIGFVQAYSFKYSPRPGTPAAEMGDPVPAAVADDRLQSLQQLLNEQQGAFNRLTVGRRVPVLFDRPGRQPGQLLGRTPWMQVVHAQAPDRLLGRIVDVDVTGAGPNSLAGSLALADPPPLGPAVAAPAVEVPA